MSEGHTHGPWVAEDDDGYSIWSIRGHSGLIARVIGDSAETDANALLIASAPDLTAENERLRAEVDGLNQGLAELERRATDDYRDSLIKDLQIQVSILDGVVHALGIEDAFTGPVDAINALYAERDCLRAIAAEMAEALGAMDASADNAATVLTERVAKARAALAKAKAGGLTT